MSNKHWVLKVLELLQPKVDDKRILKCDDLDALEREIQEFGDQNAPTAVPDNMPRPFGYSSKYFFITIYLAAHALLTHYTGFL
jgi:hypothetical protein